MKDCSSTSVVPPCAFRTTVRKESTTTTPGLAFSTSFVISSKTASRSFSNTTWRANRHPRKNLRRSHQRRQAHLSRLARRRRNRRPERAQRLGSLDRPRGRSHPGPDEIG